ncbi:hypothetical protein ACI782_05640 [Geodermatophilus sp. SYSU D00703]
MSPQSRRVAGVVLVVLPTVVLGGVSVLSLLIGDAGYRDNPLRQDLWRAGHAHAGVLLLLSLVALRYVDEARLSERARWFVRLTLPAAAVLLPVAFFLSVLMPQAREPSPVIYLAYAGAVVLVSGLLTLAVGLFRSETPRAAPSGSPSHDALSPPAPRGPHPRPSSPTSP